MVREYGHFNKDNKWLDVETIDSVKWLPADIISMKDLDGFSDETKEIVERMVR